MKLPHLKPLCLLITLFSTGAVYALEALEDEVMSESTGEGIAFLPEDFSMVMRGADNTVDAGTGFVLDTDVTTNRAKDTGYVRFIPVGPLTAAATAAGAGKGDIFLYGIGLSKADGNSNSRFNNSAEPSIKSWGTSDNPWLFKTQTANSIPSFAATGTGDVTYFAFEAPLYHKTPPTTPATGLDAYNLKLAYWGDAFVRDPSEVENMTATGAQFDLGGGNRANRLRLQGIWDGFSINGSEIRMFQTLNGAVTGTNGMDSFYNNTLGLTGVLRFNSGDTTELRAETTGTATRSTSTNMRYTTTYLGQPGAAPAANTLYRLRSIDTVDTITDFSWTPPASMDTLRFSTQECGTGNPNGCTTPVAQGLLETSAIHNGTPSPAPTFAPNEGLNLYSPNFNLILGQLYQPLVVGVAEDHKNLVLEVARIANRQDVYSQIYTRYPGDAEDAGVTYSGSTCNVHQCGAELGGALYQSKTATHSSISIGSTNYDSVNNLLTADKSERSIGVSFGALTSVPTTTITNRYYQLEQQTRLRNTNTQWRYDSATGPLGTNNCNTTSGECYEFNVATWKKVDSFNQSTIAAAYNPTIAHVAQNVTGQTNPVVPAWSALPGASYSGTTWTSTTAPGSQYPMSPNNLGSAVIDGLLIQHLKITTKGL